MGAVGAAALLLAAGCSASPAGPGGASRHHMSAHDVANATRAAREELQHLRAGRAVVTSVSADARPGKVAQSNTGHPCSSGRELRMRLIGYFPEITTAGHPVPPGAPVPDTSVRAVDLTVDARSGITCLIGVMTAEAGVADLATRLDVDLNVPSKCLPSRLRAEPTTVAAGGTVTVTSAPFECGARYEPGKLYALELLSLGRANPLELGSFPVDDDGSFRAVVCVPADASPGESYVVAHGTAFDQPCARNASCAGYDVRLVVTAPDSTGGPTLAP